MDSFIQSAAGTTYTGLATYGRIQSIMNTVGGFIVAIIFFTNDEHLNNYFYS